MPKILIAKKIKYCSKELELYLGNVCNKDLY